MKDALWPFDSPLACFLALEFARHRKIVRGGAEGASLAPVRLKSAPQTGHGKVQRPASEPGHTRVGETKKRAKSGQDGGQAWVGKIASTPSQPEPPQVTPRCRWRAHRVTSGTTTPRQAPPLVDAQPARPSGLSQMRRVLTPRPGRSRGCWRRCRGSPPRSRCPRRSPDLFLTRRSPGAGARPRAV